MINNIDVSRFRIKRSFDHAYQVLIRGLCQKSVSSILSFIIRADDPLLIARKHKCGLSPRPISAITTCAPILDSGMVAGHMSNSATDSSSAAEKAASCEMQMGLSSIKNTGFSNESGNCIEKSKKKHKKLSKASDSVISKGMEEVAGSSKKRKRNAAAKESKKKKT